MATVNPDTGTTVLLKGDILMMMPRNMTLRLSPISIDDTGVSIIKNPFNAFNNNILKSPRSSFGRVMNTIVPLHPDLVSFRNTPSRIDLSAIFTTLGIYDECKKCYDKLAAHSDIYMPVNLIAQGNAGIYRYADLSLNSPINTKNHAIINNDHTNLDTMGNTRSIGCPLFKMGKKEKLGMRYWYCDGSVDYPLLNIVTSASAPNILRAQIKNPSQMYENEYLENDYRHRTFVNSRWVSDGMADILPATRTEYIARFTYDVFQNEPDRDKILAFIILCAYCINYFGATTHMSKYNTSVGNGFTYGQIKGGKSNCDPSLEAAHKFVLNNLNMDDASIENALKGCLDWYVSICVLYEKYGSPIETFIADIRLDGTYQRPEDIMLCDLFRITDSCLSSNNVSIDATLNVLFNVIDNTIYDIDISIMQYIMQAYALWYIWNIPQQDTSKVDIDAIYDKIQSLIEHIYIDLHTSVMQTESNDIRTYTRTMLERSLSTIIQERTRSLLENTNSIIVDRMVEWLLDKGCEILMEDNGHDGIIDMSQYVSYTVMQSYEMQEALQRFLI